MRKLIFRTHAITKMFERGITTAEVRHVIEHGETLREYPEDKPYTSRLMLGWVAQRPIHVVAADISDSDETIIITAYQPDPKIWHADFKTKKENPS